MPILTLIPSNKAEQPNGIATSPIQADESRQTSLTAFIHQVQIALRKKPVAMRELLSLYQQILNVKDTIERQKINRPFFMGDSHAKLIAEKANPDTKPADTLGFVPPVLKQLKSIMQAWLKLKPKLEINEKAD